MYFSTQLLCDFCTVFIIPQLHERIICLFKVRIGCFIYVLALYGVKGGLIRFGVCSLYLPLLHEVKKKQAGENSDRRSGDRDPRLPFRRRFFFSGLLLLHFQPLVPVGFQLFQIQCSQGSSLFVAFVANRFILMVEGATGTAP